MWFFRGGSGRLRGRAGWQWARGVVRTVSDFTPWSARWGTATNERRQDNNNPQALENPQPSRLLLQSGDLFLRQSGYKLLLQDQRYDPGAFISGAPEADVPAVETTDADDPAPYDFAAGLAVQDAAVVADQPPPAVDAEAETDDDDPAPFDFTASTAIEGVVEQPPLAVDVEAEADDEDPAPFDFTASTAIQDVADQPPGAADGDVDDSDEDPAPVDWYAATPLPAEHDVPTAALPDSGIFEDAEDDAPLDFIASLAVEDFIAPADQLPVTAANDDDSMAPDGDEAPYDWTGGLVVCLNEDAPPEPGVVAEWHQRVRRRRG
jgi:hypothetical protein